PFGCHFRLVATKVRAKKSSKIPLASASFKMGSPGGYRQKTNATPQKDRDAKHFSAAIAEHKAHHHKNQQIFPGICGGFCAASPGVAEALPNRPTFCLHL
ncbi:MAG: hypothetical protein ONB49_10285, partial [candidate division KSB1 bacterium]|nr:hypothetical protein [candidate division KSB1 bacterium]